MSSGSSPTPPSITGSTRLADPAVPAEDARPIEHALPIDHARPTELVEVPSPGRDPRLRALAAASASILSGDELSTTRARLADVLGLLQRPALAEAAEPVASWSRDGVDGVELRWSTGHGAPTVAWLLRPAGEARTLPGVLALHDHGGFTRFGREKLADGPDGVPSSDDVTRAELLAFRRRYYGGRAVASDLARAGFAVLVPDAFGWGSRRTPDAAVAERFHRSVDLQLAGRRAEAQFRGAEIVEVSPGQRSELLATANEPQLAKELGVLGTSFAGLVLRDDLIALDQLATAPGVAEDAIGCFGLSGGGARAVLLAAMDDRVRASVVIAMMSTFAAVLDGHADQHSWSFLSPGLSRVGDWPELAALRPSMPLLVQYADRDELFAPEGMRAAHEIISHRYRAAGHGPAYLGVFHDAPHAFTVPMQAEAAAWLAAALTPTAR